MLVSQLFPPLLACVPAPAAAAAAAAALGVSPSLLKQGETSAGSGFSGVNGEANGQNVPPSACVGASRALLGAALGRVASCPAAPPQLAQTAGALAPIISSRTSGVDLHGHPQAQTHDSNADNTVLQHSLDLVHALQFLAAPGEVATAGGAGESATPELSLLALPLPGASLQSGASRSLMLSRTPAAAEELLAATGSDGWQSEVEAAAGQVSALQQAHLARVEERRQHTDMSKEDPQREQLREMMEARHAQQLEEERVIAGEVLSRSLFGQMLLGFSAAYQQVIQRSPSEPGTNDPNVVLNNMLERFQASNTSPFTELITWAFGCVLALESASRVLAGRTSTGESATSGNARRSQQLFPPIFKVAVCDACVRLISELPFAELLLMFNPRHEYFNTIQAAFGPQIPFEFTVVSQFASMLSKITEQAARLFARVAKSGYFDTTIVGNALQDVGAKALGLVFPEFCGGALTRMTLSEQQQLMQQYVDLNPDVVRTSPPGSSSSNFDRFIAGNACNMLTVLSSLVEEFNDQHSVSYLSLTQHRRAVNLFRDRNVLGVFFVSQQVLRMLFGLPLMSERQRVQSLQHFAPTPSAVSQDSLDMVFDNSADSFFPDIERPVPNFVPPPGLSIAEEEEAEAAIRYREAELCATNEFLINSVVLRPYQFIESISREISDGTLPPVQELGTAMVRQAAKRLSLDLATQSLSFDFIGTQPDDVSDELGTVQVPTLWKSLFASGLGGKLSMPATSNISAPQVEFSYYLTSPALFFHVYERTVEQHSSTTALSNVGGTTPSDSSLTFAVKALQCLVVLVSVRKSLLRGEEARSRYLSLFLYGTLQLLKNNVTAASLAWGLENQQSEGGEEHMSCHFEFCRLLARIKGNYQLTQLTQCEFPGSPAPPAQDGESSGMFVDWVTTVCQFSQQSLQSWNYTPQNSIFYILAFWSRIAASMEYAKKEPNVMRLCPAIFAEFITSRLSALKSIFAGEDIPGNGCLEMDPIEFLQSEQLLLEQLETISSLGRCDYQQTAQHMIGWIDPLLQEAQAGMAQQAQQQYVASYGWLSPTVCTQLSWCVYLVGSLVGGRGAASSDTDDMLDGELSARIFTLLQYLDQETNASITTLQAPSDTLDDESWLSCIVMLESSMLHFLQKFKNCYVTESSSLHRGAISYLTGGTESSLQSQYPDAPSQNPCYIQLYTHLGANYVADETQALTIIIRKIYTNLCSILLSQSTAPSIVSHTIKLLEELTGSYRTAKALNADTEIVQNLLLGQNDVNSENFPCLYTRPEQLQKKLGGVSLAFSEFAKLFDHNLKYRALLYKSLGRLLFMEENIVHFPRFVQIFHVRMLHLRIIVEQSLRDSGQQFVGEDNCRELVGLLTDLRGLTSACASRRSYLLMFEFLNNTHFPLLSTSCSLVLQYIQSSYQAAGGMFRVASVPGFIWQTASVILKFFAEFCSNFGGRINFDSNSVNGFLLFKLSSQILVTYGQVLIPILESLALDGSDENIHRVYKLVYQCILVLSNTICGTYVNFGVFSLYQDASWQQSFDAVLQMALHIPAEDLGTFVKLRRNFYNFCEHLAQVFPGQIALLDAQRLNALLQRILLSIDSDDAAISTKCCSVTDKIVSYYVKLRHSVGLLQMFDQSAADTVRGALAGSADSELGEAILAEVAQSHGTNSTVGEFQNFAAAVEANMPTFDRILATLFRRVLRTTSSSSGVGAQQCSNQYSVSRPMLALIVLHPENFDSIAQRLVAAQQIEGTDPNAGPNASQIALDKAFGELMKDVLVDGGGAGDPAASAAVASLEPRNRDRFSQQLNGFVTQCAKFLVANVDLS